MTTKMIQCLLGDNLNRIDDIGKDPFLLYLLIRSRDDDLLKERSWPNSIDQSGHPLSVQIDVREYKYILDYQRMDDAEGFLEVLKSNEWIFDFVKEESGIFSVVPALLDDNGNKVYSFEKRVMSKDVYNPDESISTNQKIDAIQKNTNKKDNVEDIISDSKEETEKHRQKYKKRRENRDKRNFEEAINDWHDEGKADEFEFERSKHGLLRMYKSLFKGKFNTDPIPLYTSGKPNKHAHRLFQYIKDYDIETAMESIKYAIENWEEIKDAKYWSGPPTPESLTRLRHELCFNVKQGKDPLEDMDKSSNEEVDINEDEWEEGDFEDFEHSDFLQ